LNISLGDFESLLIEHFLLLGPLFLSGHGHLLRLQRRHVGVRPDLLLVHGQLHVRELVRRVANVRQRVLRTRFFVEVDCILTQDFSFLGVHFVAEVHEELFKVID